MNGNNKGVKQISVDGKAIKGNLVPYAAGKHTIEVYM
jgi:cellobiose phosphorylase